MKGRELEGIIHEVSELADSVPEPYRVACFSIVLEHILSIGDQVQHAKKHATPNGEVETAPKKLQKALAKIGLTEDEIAIVEGEGS